MLNIVKDRQQRQANATKQLSILYPLFVFTTTSHIQAQPCNEVWEKDLFQAKNR